MFILKQTLTINNRQWPISQVLLSKKKCFNHYYYKR